MSGLGVSPAAGLLAPLGGFTKFFVVPTERLLRRVSGGGASGAVSSRFTAVSSQAVLGERVDEVSEASHFCPQLLYLGIGGGARDG